MILYGEEPGYEKDVHGDRADYRCLRYTYSL